MIEITLIGHAFYKIKTNDVVIHCDPVLNNTFESGANTRVTPISVADINLQEVDVVFISHRHFDHFDLESILYYKPDILFLIPHDDSLIATTLETLNRKNVIKLEPGSAIKFGKTMLLATPSIGSLSEIGLLVNDGENTVWNTVDTIIDKSIIENVTELFPVDIALINYNPLIQEKLTSLPFGEKFPLKAYKSTLELTKKLSAKLTIPSACGFYYSIAQWMNFRSFPVSEKRFINDVNNLLGLKAISLNSFDTIIADGSNLELKKCKNRQSFIDNRYLDPSKGIPDFQEIIHDNEHDKKIDFISYFFEHDFKAILEDERNFKLLDFLKEWDIVWILKVYTYGYDFFQINIDFKFWVISYGTLSESEASIETLVSASRLFDLINFDISLYSFILSDSIRNSHNIYTIKDGEIKSFPKLTLDPLLSALDNYLMFDQGYIEKKIENYKRNSN